MEAGELTILLDLIPQLSKAAPSSLWRTPEQLNRVESLQRAGISRQGAHRPFRAGESHDPGASKRKDPEVSSTSCRVVLSRGASRGWRRRFLNDRNKPGCEFKVGSSTRGQSPAGNRLFYPRDGLKGPVLPKKDFSCPSVGPKAATPGRCSLPCSFGHLGFWFGFQCLPQRAQRDSGQRTTMKAQKMKEFGFALTAGGQGWVFVPS